MYHFQVAEYSAHDFAATTTVHGLKHILNRQNSFIAKCVWFFWIFISFIFCIVLLSNVVSRWNADPLIVSLNDRPEPVWEIPFPAITICPETKAKTTVFNFTRYYHLLMKSKLDTIKKEPNYE